MALGCLSLPGRTKCSFLGLATRTWMNLPPSPSTLIVSSLCVFLFLFFHWLKTAHIYCLMVLDGSQKSEIHLTRLKSRWWQGCVPFWGLLRDSLVSSLSLPACLPSLAPGPLTHSKPAVADGVFVTLHPSDTDSPAPSSTWWTLVTTSGSPQENLPISRSAD